MSDPGALVYVVDDDASAREGVARLIRSAGLMAKTFASGEEFLAAPRPRKPSCLVLDVNLPGLNGLDLQQELAKSHVEVPIIFLTGHGDIPMTVRAVKAGAVNFLTKPFDGEELLNAIRQCIASYEEEERLYLESEIRPDYNFEEMIGDSPVWRRVLHQINTVAPTDAGVLLLGETGTGKELIARAIHSCSQRKERSLVKLSCAAVPMGLLESELFGHEKGAFTGALAKQTGRFELANKGTLFLDEVGDIPLELQTKLLRALQEQEFERLGNPHTIKVDVRVIAATNRDLSQMVKERTFREDLYYRLNVFPIVVPPLRERNGDIELLVRHFVAKYAARMRKPIESIPAPTMKVLRHYHWPGNVRELEHFVERAVILSPANVLQVPVEELLAGTVGMTIPTLEEGEREQILRALRACGGVIGGPKGAAARLAINRSTLNSRMRKLGISRADVEIARGEISPRALSSF